MNISKLILFMLLLVLSLMICDANAQFFAKCRTCSEGELKDNIRAHSEHTFRLNEKFLNGYYRQNPLPSDFTAANLSDVQNYLNKLQTGKGAVLYYAHDERTNQLCTWLISADRIDSHKVGLNKEVLQSQQPRLMDVLGVTGAARMRAPRKRGVRQLYPVSHLSQEEKKEALQETSELFFPRPIAQQLIDGRIDTLIIVPISAVGTLPFGALHVANKSLVDILSVVIAPGFSNFIEEPKTTRRNFANPIIVGDPQYPEDPDWDLPQLPGARKEAEEVAQFLQTSALIGPEASKKAVKEKLQTRSDTGLIFLATHGIADSDNPLDASLLWLSDGRWPARELQNLPLRESKPLVVMSACQTGLGKNFDVGTIGMARAWHRAGASNVVMSLWSVDDAATRLLMTDFIKLVSKMPPDKALQEAMRRTRKELPEPALWAGFSVFGLPEFYGSISEGK